METNKPLQGIDTVIVRVSDIQRARAWYAEKLGLGELWYDEKLRLCVMDSGSAASLTLWQTDKPIRIDPETASYPIFRADDARAARQHLIARGVTAGEVIEDDVTRYFFFHDPDGNVLEACEVHG